MTVDHLSELREVGERAREQTRIHKVEKYVGRITPDVVDALLDVVELAQRYREWVALDGSYPGHEEYVEAEATEIAGQLDDAQEALDAALARLNEGSP